MASLFWIYYYQNFRVLPLGWATTLTLSLQFFVLLLIGPMLRDNVGIRHVLAITLGFMGVIVASNLWQPHQVDWGIFMILSASSWERSYC